MRKCLVLVVSAFLILPCRAETDEDVTFAVNNSFFEGIPVSPDAEILMVMADLKSLAHGEADAELIQYPQPNTDRLPYSCGLDSSPPVPFTLDCGVTMLGVESRGDQAVYYFLLKTHQGDWYQIVKSPQSGAMTWVKDPHANGLGFSLHRLFDWLQSLDSYQTAHEITDPVRAIPVGATPQDNSEESTVCASYEDGEGLIPAEDKARHGDWIHVVCLENECYATNDPARACIPHMNLQGVPCVQGWSRWRSKESRLLLYPFDALSQGC